MDERTESFPLKWIDDWISQTGEMNNRERWFLRTVMIGYPLGGVVHMGFLFLFLHWTVSELVWFNVASIFFYGGMVVLASRRKILLSYLLTVLEVNLHAALAVYFVGWGTGLQYYILTTILACPMILKHFWGKIALIVGQVLFFVGLYQYTTIGSPVYRINTIELQWLNSINILAAFSFSSLITAFYMSIAQRAEEALENEHEKSERLLRNVFPEPIALRLKQDQSTIANRFSEASILFGDLVGFTELAQNMSPEELVNMLDHIFSQFDELVEKHNLEKIKTVGDAYMVVSGLPLPCSDHASTISRFALDMRHSLDQFNREKEFDLDLRIGIHSGEVVAGVIGKKRFLYDLWGHSVNQASRMESHGIPGKIQITEETRKQLGSSFQVEQRGNVEIKGIGEVTTYFLNDIDD